MSVVDPGLAPEIAQEIRTVLTEYVDKKLNDHDTRVERRMKELSARGPGALTGVSGGSTTCVAMPLLGGDSKFRDWLGTGRGRMARYSANFANFRIEQKAAGLVLSPALPTNVPGISGPAELSLRLVELLPSVNLTSGGSVEYVKESGFTPNADLQVEGEVKAVTDITFAAATASVRTIATTIKASLQALADTPAMSQWLDARLRYSVQLKAEDWLLNDATAGLMTAAGAVDPLFAPATGATSLDVIGAAIAQLQAAGYSVDGVVMSGSDTNKMRLLKNSTGDYLWARPGSALGTASVWSVPLVVSPSMPAGSFLVGAFGQAAVLYSRQLLIVEVATENEDDFIRNLACFRAEERIALSIPVPAGLVKGTFTPPAALAANRK
jgi:hypothetical protein